MHLQYIVFLQIYYILAYFEPYSRADTMCARFNALVQCPNHFIITPHCLYNYVKHILLCRSDSQQGVSLTVFVMTLWCLLPWQQYRKTVKTDIT